MAETKSKKTAAKDAFKTKVVKKTTSKTKNAPEGSEATQQLKLKKVKPTKKSTTTPAPVATPKNPVDVCVLFDKHDLSIAELDPLTVSQLKNLCRVRKVVGYSGKRKGDIMQLLTKPLLAVIPEEVAPVS